MSQFLPKDYLVVKLKTSNKEKNMGFKCIPARWVQNTSRGKYVIIRYPEEENDETILQVKHRKLPNKKWPPIRALTFFTTDSYEEAIAEVVKFNLFESGDEMLDYITHKTEVSVVIHAPVKRKQENDKNTTNEDNVSKMRRKSAIRSESNLRKLIRNKQVNSHTQKSPKKVQSLKKEAWAETHKTLIDIEQFTTTDELYTTTTAAKSHVFTDNDEAKPSCDSDSDEGSETVSECDRLELAPNVPNTTIITTKTPKRSRTHETVDANASHISYTNNVAEPIISRCSLNPDLSYLDNLIRDLAPPNVTNNDIVEDMVKIHNTILDVKSKLIDVYIEKSKELKKAFESVGLFVPELKKDLILPPIQELIDKSRTINNESNLPNPQELLTKQSSSNIEEPFSGKSEPLTQSMQPSTSSDCRIVAKWTLNHQGPGLGLEELMPNSGIYVSEAAFTRCKHLATDMSTLGRLILPLIFTEEALLKCCYTGNGKNGKSSKSKDTRPGLDGHARKVLLDFATNHAKESGWTVVSPYTFFHSLTDSTNLSKQYNRAGHRSNRPMYI